MNSEQIKKLAAAGLTVEQIAVVAEVMEPGPCKRFSGSMVLPAGGNIETKVQHGELTVWPEKKPFNHDNNSVTQDH